MKIIRIILIVLAVLLFIGGIVYLINKNQNDSANANVFKAIPADADAVAVINLEAFMSLFFRNISDVLELSEELKDNTHAEKLQKEMKLSGINLSRKVAIFMQGDQTNVLVPIKNTDDFTSYLEEMVKNSSLSRLEANEFYSHELEAFLTFDKKLCFISQCKKNDVDQARNKWIQIQANLQSEAPVAEEIQKLQNAKEHLALYMKENQMAARSMEFKHSPAALSRLTFEDGRIKITSLLSSSEVDIKNPLQTDGKGVPKSDYLSIHIDVDPSANWDYWLTESAINELKERVDNSSSSSNQFENWAGEFSFSLTGIENNIAEVISYEYDDNFNAIEKKEMREVKQLGYTGNMSFIDSVPSSLTVSEIVPAQTTFSTIEDKTLWFGSKENISMTNVNQDASIYLSANPANLIDMAIEMGIPFAKMGKRFTTLAEEIEISAIPNGNTIESEVIISMPDKDMNSLVYLFREMQKLNF